MLAAAVLNFAVDPLQIFRPARLFTAVYSHDSRLQNAGLIKSQTFDTVFMGTSLAIHFRQSDIDRILGVQSLKLAMSGSSSREQTFVLAAAMARHPKRVIWEVDDWIWSTISWTVPSPHACGSTVYGSGTSDRELLKRPITSARWAIRRPIRI